MNFISKITVPFVCYRQPEEENLWYGHSFWRKPSWKINIWNETSMNNTKITNCYRNRKGVTVNEKAKVLFNMAEVRYDGAKLDDSPLQHKHKRQSSWNILWVWWVLYIRVTLYDENVTKRTNLKLNFHLRPIHWHIEPGLKIRQYTVL